MKKSAGFIVMLGISMVTVLSACQKKEVADGSNETVAVQETQTQEKKAPYKVKVEELKIENGDNTIYGKVYYPDVEGKFPAIIMSHGYNGANTDFVAEGQYYATNGYVAYAFDFCGGSGKSKSTGDTTEMSVMTEKSDVIAIFNYFTKMDKVDEDKIFLFGGSQGGLVTALATEELGEKVAGMALYFPAFNIPDDWRKTYPTVESIPETVDFWGMCLGRKFIEDIHDLQVFNVVGEYSNNVLILQGDKDMIVPMSYAQEAQKKYPHAELIVMEGEGHGFTPAGATKARQYVLDFMNENK